MKFADNAEDQGPRVNLTALIDIVFLLLIFFMVTTQFIDAGGLKLTLPKAATTTQQQDVSLTLSVDAEGRYFLGDNLVAGELVSAVKEWLPSDKAARRVMLKADGQASHQSVVTAMDALARNGVEDVRIASVNK